MDIIEYILQEAQFYSEISIEDIDAIANIRSYDPSTKFSFYKKQFKAIGKRIEKSDICLFLQRFELLEQSTTEYLKKYYRELLKLEVSITNYAEIRNQYPEIKELIFALSDHLTLNHIKKELLKIKSQFEIHLAESQSYSQTNLQPLPVSYNIGPIKLELKEEQLEEVLKIIHKALYFHYIESDFNEFKSHFQEGNSTFSKMIWKRTVKELKIFFKILIGEDNLLRPSLLITNKTNLLIRSHFLQKDGKEFKLSTLSATAAKSDYEIEVYSRLAALLNELKHFYSRLEIN